MATTGLRVVTYDVGDHAGADDGPCGWQARSAGVLKLLVRLNADVLCVQGLTKRSVCDIQGSALSAVYDAAVARSDSTSSSACLMVLWRRRLLAAVRTSVDWLGPQGLQPHWTPDPRGVPGAVMVQGVALAPAAFSHPPAVFRTVLFVNVQGDAPWACGEHEELASVLAEHAAECGMLTAVLCGGLGARFAMRASELVEAVPRVAPFVCTPTYVPFTRDVLTRGAQTSRHDRIFHGPHLRLAECTVQATRTDLWPGTPDDFAPHPGDFTPRFPSDHLPLLAVFAESP